MILIEKEENDSLLPQFIIQHPFKLSNIKIVNNRLHLHRKKNIK